MNQAMAVSPGLESEINYSEFYLTTVTFSRIEFSPFKI